MVRFDGSVGRSADCKGSEEGQGEHGERDMPVP
jgi:hypothetical protein